MSGAATVASFLLISHRLCLRGSSCIMLSGQRAVFGACGKASCVHSPRDNSSACVSARLPPFQLFFQNHTSRACTTPILASRKVPSCLGGPGEELPQIGLQPPLDRIHHLLSNDGEELETVAATTAGKEEPIMIGVVVDKEIAGRTVIFSSDEKHDI